MSVRIVELDVSGEWNSDEDLMDKLVALFATADWCAEMAIEDIGPYGPEDDDE